MIDRMLAMLLDTSLWLFGILTLALLYAIHEAGVRIGFWRGLVVQEANAITTAWLRSKLIAGDEGPVITALVENYAQVELAYITAKSTGDEPALITLAGALQRQIWQTAQTVARREPSSTTAALITSLVNMFAAATAERFAFESQVPADLSWMLMAGSLLAIGAMGYHLGVSGTRQVALTSLLLVMWAGGTVLIADLNRPRVGVILVDPAPLIWAIQGFGKTR